MVDQNDNYVYDPLDRETFEAISYNAVGRASEIGTYPAYGLVHSRGNSGWSVGIMQWDFGQTGRREKVNELLAGYQAWTNVDQRFTAGEIASLTTRLQTPGQTGNALTQDEQSRLNSYLRSDTGRTFVNSLNQEQVQKKWENVGQPLSEIEWLQDLRRADPEQAAEIVAMAGKLYNQNEIRGGRLIDNLANSAMTSDEANRWIGDAGIQGLNPDARAAIVSGRDSALAGVRLMNSLETGGGQLSQAWREQVHTNHNVDLSSGFNTNPEVQLLDGMMRHPANGERIRAYIEDGAPARQTVITGRNDLAREEMSRIELSRDGELTLQSPNGDTFERTHDGWNRNGVPMESARPRREMDYPDHTQGMRMPMFPAPRARAGDCEDAHGQDRLRARPQHTPDHPEHPDHAMLEQIRAGVHRLDSENGRSYNDTSERISRSLLAECKDQGHHFNALTRADHVVLSTDRERIFAVQGRLDDPAHSRANVFVAQAAQTPVEQSDQRLEAANQRIAVQQTQEQHRTLQQEEARQRSPETQGPPLMRT